MSLKTIEKEFDQHFTSCIFNKKKVEESLPHIKSFLFSQIEKAYEAGKKDLILLMLTNGGFKVDEIRQLIKSDDPRE